MEYNIKECLFFRRSDLDSFFSDLSEEEYSFLKTGFQKEEIKKGHHIFRAGEEPKGLIYLDSGSAKVFKNKSGKREQIVRLVHHHSFVGYKALFAKNKHTTNAVVIEDAVTTIINKEVLFTIMEKNALFSMMIVRALANELSFNFERLINLTQKHLRGRIAETLIILSELYGFEADGATLDLRITRENIAFFSNMTTSNAIRTIKAFEEEGFILTENKKIKLLSMSELEKISKNG